MLKPHKVLLHEFAELILNQRVEQKPSSLRHSNVLNLWQIKGIWVNENSDLRLQMNFYIQKWNTRILVEVWVLEVIITNDDQAFKKTQRLALLQSRSILGILANLPLSQEIPSFNKHMKIAYNIENSSIPQHFQTINFPVIPCPSKKVTYLYIQVHYQKEIVFSPQPKLAQKPITQREDAEMNTLHQIQKSFRNRTKASSQIAETLEYFNLINQTL
ncbi:unnamed protein product (macronuclear) [Paramecium tetraurelia]|uniref:Autophagy-related protein 13 N-terminal domain-containing protein n=1 Tax=Paramecium tetraurelia TaxID=5888 RepID=A0CBY9_PARTE|nr:uncharacterized protein GSPATT00037090001 [Paramecium tetraurelia]CAK68306.1 unnamed protein product [Paramecium tetraurelia]|eukprot:XP_001435703.1 hypothetical protein (macronuclear) [Paramecium tetraurelia strain d4-2]